MEDNTFSFTHKCHKVQVSQQDVTDYLGNVDEVFTVLINGNKIVVPGIWNASQEFGRKGIKLVVRAYLDGLPLTGG